ncbi:MAG: indigoidine synthase A family [Erysipelotrichaceae bacterium]|nr:MAG: indigoidine synthase A family [Erysipelotrichaceae bacterium]
MLKINQEIKDALSQGKAVVALESTIISHGMPYPQNVQTALEVEAEIRANGAIPATIGIIDGIMVVGMSPDEIEVIYPWSLRTKRGEQPQLPQP